MIRFSTIVVIALIVGGCKGPGASLAHGRWMTRDLQDPAPPQNERREVNASAGHIPSAQRSSVEASLSSIPLGTASFSRTKPVLPSPVTRQRSIPVECSIASPMTAQPRDEPENLMPRKRWNWLSIPAFLLAGATLFIALTTVQTALVLLLAGSTLIVAGISLKRIRKREQAGKGFALIALVVGIIALLLTGVAIAVYGLV